MNGTESLVRPLVGGVNVCFAHPGTSKTRFVAALDRIGGMRCVLGLFEGVVTGAADGYATDATKGGLLRDHASQAWSDHLATRLQERGA